MSRLGMRTECPEQLGEQALPHTLSFSPTGEIATEKASLGIGCTSWGGLTGESNWFSYSLQCAQCSFFFLQWWAEISHLYCYVPTRTLFSGPASLGINLKELKAQTQTHYCAPEVIAALFMIAKSWKQLKCPVTHEWITNTWYIHTLAYHSVIKSIEVLTHAAIW